MTRDVDRDVRNAVVDVQLTEPPTAIFSREFHVEPVIDGRAARAPPPPPRGPQA